MQLAEGYAIAPGDAEEDAIALGCTARLEVRYLDRMSAQERGEVVKWLLTQAMKILQEEITGAMVTSELSLPH